jgi:hypothetical protein
VTFVNKMSETIWVAAAPNPATPLAGCCPPVRASPSPPRTT